MARGDSIGGMSGYASSSTYVYLTPSSGDEWMITAVGAGPYTYSYLQMTPDNGSNWYAMYASMQENTGVSQYMASNDMMSRDLNWILTENDRIRSYNASGAHILWYTGIKIKD